MYIKVLIGEYVRNNIHHESSEILINPDCPVRVIYDYIRKCLELDNDLEYDLCDEGVNLIFIYEKDPWLNGKNCLVPKSTYFIVLFERNEDNKITNPMLYIPDTLKKYNNQINDLLTKIRKQILPGISNKQSRTGKICSGTFNNMKQPLGTTF